MAGIVYKKMGISLNLLAIPKFSFGSSKNLAVVL
jgi:hypothetical protein